MKRVEMKRVKMSPTSTPQMALRHRLLVNPAHVRLVVPAAIAVPVDVVAVADVAQVRAAVVETPAVVVLRRRNRKRIDGIGVALRRGPFLLLAEIVGEAPAGALPHVWK